MLLAKKNETQSKTFFLLAKAFKGLNSSVSSAIGQGVMLLLRHVKTAYAWFPRGIESIEEVLNFQIVFQDLEKVLNFAKMYIR